MTTQHAWQPGSAPVAVVMISFNEAHNLPDVLDNITGWAREVFLVDSFSTDETVDLALARGVTVVQRRFDGFGSQWDFAANALPFKAPWTMKLDPDERLTPALKSAIEQAIAADQHDALYLWRRLWFMGRPMPVRQKILRLWRTGICRFPSVAVNEQPLVSGRQAILSGDLEHHDSPTLHHWYDKQNRYTTAEALMAFRGEALSTEPRLLGDGLQRRMWLKQMYGRMPLRHQIMFLYCLLGAGGWRAGRAGFIWARLRAEVYRMIDYKRLEMTWHGRGGDLPRVLRGAPHAGAIQADQLGSSAARARETGTQP